MNGNRNEQSFDLRKGSPNGLPIGRQVFNVPPSHLAPISAPIPQNSLAVAPSPIRKIGRTPGQETTNAKYKKLPNEPISKSAR